MSFKVKGKVSFYFLFLTFFPVLAMGQNSSSTMSDEAKAAQIMQNLLYPQVQLPLTYNFNQKLGSNSGIQQTEIGFNPIIPIGINDEVQVILNPMLTYNHNAHDQQVTNQNQSIQLASYLAPAHTEIWRFGLGPYLQTPATNSNNGSMQTGLGVAAATFYTPDHWVIGGSFYNSWGLGGNLSGGSANILNIQPAISYIADKAWSFNLSSQANFYRNAKSPTNQITFNVGKTMKISDLHVQYQIGPTYMTTTNSTSAKGFGAFAGINILLPK